MKEIGSVLHCPNCGVNFTSTDTSETSALGTTGCRCPVCHLRFTPATSENHPGLASAEDFESCLSSLVELARTSGLGGDEILQVLRDELAFTAELANRGRHVCVQVIDLGPQDERAENSATRDGREILLSHRGTSDRLR